MLQIKVQKKIFKVQILKTPNFCCIFFFVLSLFLIPGIPLRKRFLFRGTLIRIPKHRAPNHQPKLQPKPQGLKAPIYHYTSVKVDGDDHPQKMD